LQTHFVNGSVLEWNGVIVLMVSSRDQLK